MTQREALKFLFDIQQACILIERFTAGKTLEEYSADPLLRSAVERQFSIIGEAMNQALRVEPEIEARITETRRIVAFRNRLIHGYASMADDVVWGIIETKLSVLHQEVDSILKNPDT